MRINEVSDMQCESEMIQDEGEQRSLVFHILICSPEIVFIGLGGDADFLT